MNKQIGDAIEDGRKGLLPDFWLRYFNRIFGLLSDYVPPDKIDEVLEAIQYHSIQVGQLDE